MLPDLDQIDRQARELLAGADPSTFSLDEARLVLARAYGFPSWARLTSHIDGVATRRLDDAIRGGDVAQVRAMLHARPELAAMAVDNHDLLHHAVLNRSAEIVRVLMDHGAGARRGLYPHVEATSPLALAAARGFDEIVGIIDSAERSRRADETPGADSAVDRLMASIVAGRTDEAIAAVLRRPALIEDSTATSTTPLHAAAWALDERLVTWLLDRGADPTRRDSCGFTPLDAAATRTFRDRPDGLHSRFVPVAARLRLRGAELTPHAAAAMGDVERLLDQREQKRLPEPLEGTGGLLRVAVTHDQHDVLRLLLDLGFDPDERVRVPAVDEVEYSWGFPLWECAATGKHEMAETLLARGADPNARVQASGTPVSQAYGQRDARMIALLERHGGFGDVATAAQHRNTDLARRLFDRAADTKGAAEDLLGAAARGGDLALLRLALEHVAWPRDDPRWFDVLEQPLALWNHGPEHWCHPEWDRSTYLACFRLVLERCDPNLRGRAPDAYQFGLTPLHTLAGSREHVTADERIAFAGALLDAGARLDVRDRVLNSTPLGWACRWGRLELVRLFLARGADPSEPDAEPWARPRAWAERLGHGHVLDALSAGTA